MPWTPPHARTPHDILRSTNLIIAGTATLALILMATCCLWRVMSGLRKHHTNTPRTLLHSRGVLTQQQLRMRRDAPVCVITLMTLTLMLSIFLVYRLCYQDANNNVAETTAVVTNARAVAAVSHAVARYARSAQQAAALVLTTGCTTSCGLAAAAATATTQQRSNANQMRAQLALWASGTAHSCIAHYHQLL